MAEDIGGEIVIEDAALAGGFVQVPAGIFFDADLKDGPVRVYGALLWWAWKQGRAPEQKVMGEQLGMGESTVRRHLADLEKAGYIAIQQLGLGRANRYTIRRLQGQDADRSELSGLGAQKRAVRPLRTGRPPRVVGLDVTTQTLSHRGNGEALAGAFFEAVGESKPSKTRRARALEIINDLTAEGFTEAAIREACRLAGERGARGPDLLPHVIGEAHERVETRTAQATRRRQIADVGAQQLALDEASLAAELAAVEALPAVERERLERECRAALPASVSEGFAAVVVPGMIAARLRQGQATN
jgi:hypothetical protein